MVQPKLILAMTLLLVYIEYVEDSIVFNNYFDFSLVVPTKNWIIKMLIDFCKYKISCVLSLNVFLQKKCFNLFHRNFVEKHSSFYWYAQVVLSFWNQAVNINALYFCSDDTVMLLRYFILSNKASFLKGSHSLSSRNSKQAAVKDKWIFQVLRIGHHMPPSYGGLSNTWCW